MANSVDPDEKPRSVASHHGLHCLLRPISPNTYGNMINTYGKYGNKEYLPFVFSLSLSQLMCFMSLFSLLCLLYLRCLIIFK